MKTKSHLTLRSVRPFYKRFGLTMALLLTGFLVLLLGMSLVSILTDQSLLMNTDVSNGSDPGLSKYVAKVGMIIFTVPIIAYFVIAGYLAFKFTKLQFDQLERGELTNCLATVKGWLGAFSRSHVIYFIISSFSFVLFFVCAGLTVPENTSQAPALSPPMATIPLALQIVAALLMGALCIAMWGIFNLFLWLIITLPISLVSSFILRVICFKRVSYGNSSASLNTRPT